MKRGLYSLMGIVLALGLMIPGGALSAFAEEANTNPQDAVVDQTTTVGQDTPSD
ncbi:hypothetical protein [Cryptobacterium curtum]|uniref:hypothetical protein n=1 Tax=Cryptobacterium curtum TaxID=84163 RepID=UPI0028D6D6D8|nr:hypothetical protein [Cryptobacterium curtum]